MPNPVPLRHYLKDGKIYDSGVEISPAELQSFIDRQNQAIQHNKNLPIPGMGEMANKLLQPEIDNAVNIMKQIKPNLVKPKSIF